MSRLLFIGTSQGLVVGEPHKDSWRIIRSSLEGRYISSLTVLEGLILVGTQDGIFRSQDLGITWSEASRGLSIRHVRWLLGYPDLAGRALAGSEPAGIFVSQDGGNSWRSCPEVIQLREKYRWSLPYSPEAGCVRGLAFHGRRGYAAVEDGCVLVSQDAGETWHLAAGSRGDPDHMPRQGFIHSDVHSIEVQPSSPDLVAAPTGGGFFWSSDGGASWKHVYRGCYCRAVWWDSTNPNHMILGPADYVDRGGCIEETRDGGISWHSASRGLDTPWPTHMVERFAQAGEQLLAVLSNGDMLAATLNTLEWRQILPEVKGVNAVATVDERR